MSEIQRYTSHERGNHWIVAVCFILAACSGLAMFHPSFFFLASILGGGPWNRILHPFVGLLMVFFFLAIMMRFWAHNKITPSDRKWMQRVKDVIMNRDAGLPEVGKYNAGQKYLFWTIVTCLGLLLLSGLVMWRPYLAEQFPIWLVRISVVIHALSAFVLITGIIVHIYAGIWIKGSIGAMLHGCVIESHCLIGMRATRLAHLDIGGKRKLAGIELPSQGLEGALIDGLGDRHLILDAGYRHRTGDQRHGVQVLRGADAQMHRRCGAGCAHGISSWTGTQLAGGGDPRCDNTHQMNHPIMQDFEMHKSCGPHCQGFGASRSDAAPCHPEYCLAI